MLSARSRALNKLQKTGLQAKKPRKPLSRKVASIKRAILSKTTPIRPTTEKLPLLATLEEQKKKNIEARKLQEEQEKLKSRKGPVLVVPKKRKTKS